MNVFSNGLGPWGALPQILGWGIILLLPPAILLLYFLKLKRQPIEVPSTYLWSRTIEDLHVNSIWQKLRRSILLLLQLLFAFLLAFSLLRPGCSGTQLEGDRFIFLIDTSASMAARVDGTTRLDLAKQRTEQLIRSMKRGDTAMLISFSDRSDIEQSFTTNPNQLLRKLAAIRQTQHRTDLDEALRAASGLANPGRASQDERDLQVADAMPAKMFILTDGGVSRVPDFSLGNLEPEYIPIGDDTPMSNVGIIDFTVGANPENPNKRQAFARFFNGGTEDATIDVSLYLNDNLRDAMEQVAIPPGESVLKTFNSNIVTGGDTSGILKLEIETADNFDEDSTAYLIFNPPGKSRVLLLTLQNTALETTLFTKQMQKLADVNQQLPSHVDSENYKLQSAAGFYDLIIFDRCVPEKMPQANTLFIGSAPPDDRWKVGATQSPVYIIDSATTHPLLAAVELKNVLIADAGPVEGPKGSVSLIDATSGSILTIGPREGFEDAVMGFTIVETDEAGELLNNTDWPRFLSFPLFMQNVVQYLGSRSSVNTAANVPPGETVELRGSVPVNEVLVADPQGNRQTVKASRENNFVYSDTDITGVYEVSEGTSQSVDQRFAVNILDRRESDLQVADGLEIGFETVQATSRKTPARFEFWKWILIGGFVLLCAEWYIYNRRVYV